jgi:hypothetical protein
MREVGGNHEPAATNPDDGVQLKGAEVVVKFCTQATEFTPADEMSLFRTDGYGGILL